MSTKVEIANVALSSLGARLITSFTENTPEARQVNAAWEIGYQTNLQLHNWNFATKRATLAPNAVAPEYGFDAAFPYPSDLLVLQEVEDVDVYKLENKQILTSEEKTNLKIKYIFDASDTAVWPAFFSDLMVKWLALHLSFPATSAGSSVERRFNIYNDTLSKARWMDSKGEPLDKFQDGQSRFITIRTG